MVIRLTCKTTTNIMKLFKAKPSFFQYISTFSFMNQSELSVRVCFMFFLISQ